MAELQSSNTDNACLPDPGQPGPSRRDAILALGVLAFAALLAVWLIPAYVLNYATGEKGLSPRFFPYLISGGLALLGLILLNHNRRALFKTKNPAGQTGAPSEAPRPDKFVAICAALLVVYYGAVFYLGLLPASFLALIGLMHLFGFRSRIKTILFSALLVGFLFLFFEKVAQVPLPRGVWFEGLY